jgi:MoxR-like ATPase
VTQKIQGALQTVRDRLDEFVIGKNSVKEALLLSLIAQEHLFVQGEPGCAKTLLAEVTASTANLKFHFSQFHRDTRLAELVGDVVLERTPLDDGNGEIIAQRLSPGGMLTSEVVLLDDICRAPGEALNVLLRVLNNREFLNRPIPLMSAIATTNPTEDEYYNEPLDPANLDRFTFQLKAWGILSRSNWDQAREIIDLYDGSTAEPAAAEPLDGQLLKDAFHAHQQVALPQSVMGAYRKILDDLRNRYGCNASNSLLTDRTMLVKVPRMIKAMAFLRGRDTAELEDLQVLKYILTFRVPEDIYEKLDQIIEQAVEEEQREQSEGEESEQMQGMQEQEEQAVGGEDQDSEGEGENALIQEILDSLRRPLPEGHPLHAPGGGEPGHATGKNPWAAGEKPRRDGGASGWRAAQLPPHADFRRVSRFGPRRDGDLAGPAAPDPAAFLPP